MHSPVPVVSPAQAHDWLSNHEAAALDVRGAADYHHLHVAGGRHLALADTADTAPAFDHERVILVGHTTQHAQRVYHMLQRRHAATGLLPLHVLDGGMAAWQDAGLPVIHRAGRRSSLERQTCLICGAVSLSGLILSVVFSGIWLILPFVAAGTLVYIGLHGLHRLVPWLLRLPWNTAPDGPSATDRDTASARPHR